MYVTYPLQYFHIWLQLESLDHTTHRWSGYWWKKWYPPLDCYLVGPPETLKIPDLRVFNKVLDCTILDCNPRVTFSPFQYGTGSLIGILPQVEFQAVSKLTLRLRSVACPNLTWTTIKILGAKLGFEAAPSQVASKDVVRHTELWQISMLLVQKQLGQCQIDQVSMP